MSQRQQSLQLERLEDRCVPTTNFFWSGGLGLVRFPIGSLCRIGARLAGQRLVSRDHDLTTL